MGWGRFPKIGIIVINLGPNLPTRYQWQFHIWQGESHEDQTIINGVSFVYSNTKYIVLINECHRITRTRKIVITGNYLLLFWRIARATCCFCISYHFITFPFLEAKLKSSGLCKRQLIWRQCSRIILLTST